MACGHLEEHSNPHYADAAEMEIAALRKRINELESAKPSPISMKDHQIRELVNELRDIAVDYHGTQQLRERIAITIRAAMPLWQLVSRRYRFGTLKHGGADGYGDAFA